jgi:hypothetical protein
MDGTDPRADTPLATAELLARYVSGRSPAAFAELVRRHVDLVHSAARRKVEFITFTGFATQPSESPPQ